MPSGWRGPEYEGEFPSLGWKLLEWYEEYLTVPSGPMVGQPLVLTDEQARFVVRFYRIDPVTGERDKRRGVLRRPKGWGKSPLLAAMAIGELCGPVVFNGWDEDGEPMAREHRSPWVQIAACSEDQTDNTYVALFEMLRDSSAVQEFGLDVGITRVFLKGRTGRLEPVTASSGSREGQPVTFAVLDETHLWTPSNGGKKLAATIRRNVAKMDGTTIESTNAYMPGQSVAEASETARGKGQAGLLLDTGPKITMTTADLANRAKAMKNLRIVYGDSVSFMNLDRIYADATDADTDPTDALRYYFNMIVQGSEQAFDVKRWRTLAEVRTVPDKELITLGFDGSRYHDATAIVATHVESGYQWNAGVWERGAADPDDWEVPVFEVTDTLSMLFDRFDVWRLYADPWYWETQVKSEWAALWGERVVEWDTRPPKKMAYAIRSYMAAMRGGELSHDGDSVFAAHIANARRRETPMLDEEGRRLFTIQKEHPTSPNKIDMAMAGCLSWEARSDCIASNQKGQKSRALITY